MKKITAYIFVAIFSISAVLAQNENSTFWQEYIELLAEQNESESVNEDLMETLEGYLENKININDTGAHELQNLFFINDFQESSLVRYIQQNGELYSIYELEFVNGFDPETRRLLLPFIKVEPMPKTEKFSLRNMFRYGKNNITLGYKRGLETPKGYTDSTYLGDPFRTYFRYTFKYKNKVQLSFSGDKDAGEEFFKGSQKQGYDFYGFSLMLKDFGWLKQLVIGNYQLQFGQGLTLWTGASFNLSGDGSIKKMPQNIRPSGAFTEYGFMNGIATTIGFGKHVSATAFYSHVKCDGTNIAASAFDEMEDYAQSLYETGYHRTQKEIDKKNTITEDLYGAHVQYRNSNFNVGATAYHVMFDRPVGSQERLDNYNVFSGKQNTNIGIDATYLWRRILFFGEVAMSENTAFAGLAGMQFNVAENTLISAYYRDYGVEYQNLYASALGQNSDVRNERGFGLNFRTLLPWQVSMVASADAFKFPWMRYQVYSPSDGSDYRIRLTKQLTRKMTLSVNYRYKNKAKNVKLDSLLTYCIEPNKRQNFQLNLKYEASKEWTFNTRVEFSKFSTDSKGDTSGFLMAQDITYRPERIPFSFAMRYALFDAPYDARIYAFERDLSYEFSVPAHNGKGSRFYFYINWKMAPNINLSARYSIWYYPDKEFIGSGADKINDNKKQEIKLQFRVNF